MNKQATCQDILNFGNKTGVVITHTEENRSSRRFKNKKRVTNYGTKRKHLNYLVGGGRTTPQWKFSWSPERLTEVTKG